MQKIDIEKDSSEEKVALMMQIFLYVYEDENAIVDEEVDSFVMTLV